MGNNTVGNAPRNTLVRNAPLAGALPQREAASGIGEHLKDTLVGFGKEAGDTVTGLLTLATTNPLTTLSGLGYMLVHPIDTVKAIVNPYVTACKEGHPGEAVGRAGFQVLTIMLMGGPKNPSKVAAEASGQITAEMAGATAGRVAARTAAREGLTAGTEAYTARVAALTQELTPKLTARLAGTTKNLAAAMAKNGVKDATLREVMAVSAAKQIPAQAAYRFMRDAMRGGATAEAAAKSFAEVAALQGAKEALPVLGAAMAAKVPAEFANAIATTAAKKGIKPEVAARYLKHATESGMTGEAAAKEFAKLTRLKGGPALLEKRIGELTAANQTARATAAATAAAQKLEAWVANPRNAELVAKELKGLEAAKALPNADLAAIAQKQGKLQALVDALPETHRNVIAAYQTAGPVGRVAMRTSSAVGNTVNVVGDGVQAVRNGLGATRAALDAPNTLGGYLRAGGAVVAAPFRFGARQLGNLSGSLRGLAGGLKMPRFKLPSVGDLGKIPVPSPYRIITAPVTVPLAGVKYMFSHPATFSARASAAGTLGNWAALGNTFHGQDALPEEQEIAAARKDGIYPLKAGDTVQDVSTRLYGTPAFAGLIEKMNPAIFAPDAELVEGTEIKVPRVQEYQVAEGDTLASISTQIAGDESLADTIRLLNSSYFDSHPQIAPGTVILVPHGDEDAIADWQQAATPQTPGAPQAPGATPGTTPGAAPGAPVGNRPAAPAGNRPAAPAGNRPAAPAGTRPAAPAGAPAGAPAAPSPVSAADRQRLTQAFALAPSDENWGVFQREVASYRQNAVGPDAGTPQQVQAVQQALKNLGYTLPTTGSYYAADAQGRPTQEGNGTEEAVVDFKRKAGIVQGYRVALPDGTMGADGKGVPDVNPYVDPVTMRAMTLSSALIRDARVTNPDQMIAAVREATRLSAEQAVGPDLATPQDVLAVQNLLGALSPSFRPARPGVWDEATSAEVIRFKQAMGARASYNQDNGQPVFTPYVDASTLAGLRTATSQR